MLEKGTIAPQFTAQAVRLGEEPKGLSLSDYKGKKTIVYFYPKDMTPGCTNQAQNLRDNYEMLQKKGIEVIGISCDSINSHKKFVEKENIPFFLVSDKDKEIVKAYDVYGDKSFMGKIFQGISRVTYLLDEEQNIIGVIEKPKVKEHAEEIVEAYGLK
ncbi:MAG: thioredoxin-dependent thiol peroxidase [Candidatus Nanoarchaeia archaeon]